MIDSLARYIRQLLTFPYTQGRDFGAYLIRLISGTAIPKTKKAKLDDEPLTSRYRLDNDSSAIVILPDGRKLGYAEYGSPTGRAVLYQHGLPGSRIEAAAFHELGLELGVRIIAPDRPGYGWSSPHPGRTLLDWPKDLDHLIKHLQLKEYAVLVSQHTAFTYA
jgi:hypothetical protein